MSGLLWLSSVRYLLHRPWQTALSVLGITLGVAIVVAIDLGNQSAKHAFNLSSNAVSGKATHHIVGGPGGLPERVYPMLRLELGVRTSAPVVEGYAYPEGGSENSEALRVLGIDPLADAQFRPYTDSGGAMIARADAPVQSAAFLLANPNSVLMSVATADFLGIQAGDSFTLRIAGVERDVEVAGLITPRNSLSNETLRNLLIADISTAQELMGLEGRLSHIDLILPTGEQGETLKNRIAAALPSEASIISSQNRSGAIDDLTQSFDDNLFVVSLLGLIVGGFLIYNAMAFSVVQRRPVIGALRAIGVTRQQLFTTILGEALLIGAVSSLIGVLLGIVIGRGILNIITQTITDLFFVASVQELTIPFSSLLKGVLLGIFATLVAGIVPALEATGVPANDTLSRSHLEKRFRGIAPLASAAGVVLLCVGVALILLPARSLTLAFVGTGALVLGYAMLAPVWVILFTKALAPLMYRLFGAMGAIAARGIAASISRTAVAIAALAIAISISISIDTMVQSFRSTVIDWLENSLGSDVYISPASFSSQAAEDGLSPEIPVLLRSLDSVRSVRTVRNARVNSPSGDVELLAIDTTFDNFARFNSFKEGELSQIWDDLQSGEAVAVSEPYSYNNGKAIGSFVRLKTTEGLRDFRVAGIYYDYRNSANGKIMISRDAYNRFWSDNKVTGIGVTAVDGIRIEALKSEIKAVIGRDTEVEIRSNAELKAAALEVFERSFAITTVVHALSIAVAFVGVLSALMAIQMERSTEFGTLRTIGFTPKQVWMMFTSQTGLMGLAAGLLALPLGLIQGAVLIYVVNRRSFGWSMDMEVYPFVLAQAVVIAVAASLLASAYPSFKMSRSSPAEVLHEE